MAKQIGKLSVVLGANAGPLLGDLKKAGSGIKSFADTSISAFGKVARAASVIGGAAGFGGGLLAGFTLKSGVGDIIKADMQARRLGVGINDLRAAMLAGGPAADAMVSSIGNVGEKLAQASLGSTEAISSFERLAGASGGAMGLSSKTTGEAFGTVLERLAAIPNKTRQAVAAFDVLGASAADLLPELARGTSGLADAKSVAKRLGLAVDDRELANIRETAKIFQQFDALRQGFTNQIALGFSPLLNQLNTSLDLMGKFDLSGLSKSIIDITEAVSKVGASVFESFRNPEIRKTLFDLLAEAASFLGNKLAEVLNLALGSTLKSIGKIGFLDFGAAGNRVLFESKRAGDRAHWNKAGVFNAWDEMQDLTGKTSSGKWLSDFFAGARGKAGGGGSGLLGSSPLGLAGVGAGFNGAANPHLAKLMSDQFGQMRGSVKSPFETFNEEMTKISEFAKAGMFEGQAGLRERMTGQAFANLQSGVQLPQIKQPDAIMAGTKEAYSAIVQHQRGDQRLTVQEQMKALMIEAAKLDLEKIRIGRETLEAMKNRPGGVPVRGI